MGPNEHSSKSLWSIFRKFSKRSLHGRHHRKGDQKGRRTSSLHRIPSNESDTQLNVGTDAQSLQSHTLPSRNYRARSTTPMPPRATPTLRRAYTPSRSPVPAHAPVPSKPSIRHYSKSPEPTNPTTTQKQRLNQQPESNDTSNTSNAHKSPAFADKRPDGDRPQALTISTTNTAETAASNKTSETLKSPNSLASDTPTSEIHPNVLEDIRIEEDSVKFSDDKKVGPDGKRPVLRAHVTTKDSKVLLPEPVKPDTTADVEAEPLEPPQPVEFPRELETDGTYNAPLPYPDNNCKLAPLFRKLTEQQQKHYDEVLDFCLHLKEVPNSAHSKENSPLTEFERYWLSRECILRYLRATKWRVQDAKKRLVDTLVWRRQNNVNDLSPSEIEPENYTGKQVLLGYDNNGRSCVYLYPARQNTKNSPRQILHLVYSLECAIELMPPGVETLALLVNFKSTSSRSNPSVGQGKEVLSILQTHYCERLGRALVINIPWAVWGFFKLISPFIDPLTREKLKFNEPLDRYVPSDQLDMTFGGTLKFDYIHDKYWPQLVELCKTRREASLKRWRALGSKIGTSEWVTKGGEEYIQRMREYVRPSLAYVQIAQKEYESSLAVYQQSLHSRRTQPVSSVATDPSYSDNPKLLAETDSDSASFVTAINQSVT
ncbi:sec14 cytosolic factor family protein [Schizosaccharomyces japonicus yFS275]|uniref:Sec14 cytosolic factor family protein n=1 Tax=Schizosaccharomyces japonicus (strain yFS275 / FY16936) TaxID=402676 RepID=B6K2S3_SCHJY|nr:sec14 cytosolic factor family protein [Schizosaccharomyces japonicus yFS275]EEB08563.1 sec14 cytosolic factor family protein [Schizosaccharomyces japonicus yFS275]